MPGVICQGESPRCEKECRPGYAQLATIDEEVDHRPHSFSYFKLPQQLLNLSILKLDGSRFDVQISRSATVAGLKLAVEEVFKHVPNESEGKISWIHVWGHFCLCYDGYRLLNDKDSLRTFGIKDGDQLLFKRHLSINDKPGKKRRTRNHRTSQHKMSSTTLYINDEKHEGCKDGVDGDFNQEEKDYHNSIIRNAEFNLAHFLKGWLSRFWQRRRRMRLEGRIHPSS